MCPFYIKIRCKSKVMDNCYGAQTYHIIVKHLVPFINSLLSECDILLIQETWLLVNLMCLINILRAWSLIAFVEWMTP